MNEETPQKVATGSGKVAVTSSVFAVLLQAALVLAGIGLIVFGISLNPESAIHQIYQLNAVTSGLCLIGIVGVWASIDHAVRVLSAK